MNTEKYITLNNVNKVYQEGERELKVIDDVSLTFPKGKFITILGKSGCGKSTLLNMISGIDFPSSGSIKIADSDITSMSELERTLFRRNNIGIVFQFFNLIPTLNVLENVLLPLELINYEKKKLKEKAVEILSKVGMADRINSFPDVLSGGEQQRIAIARALVHNPEIIIADEPTGNLDEVNGKKIIDILKGLTKELGKTLIVATHSNDVKEYADIVYTSEKGKFIKQ